MNGMIASMVIVSASMIGDDWYIVLHSGHIILKDVVIYSVTFFIGFEWLEKLGKRGEKFDIVILDPPSSSVGKKKKRWSVKRDMDELVALAAPLVKKGGLLWTTTNSASMSPVKFARICKRGLDNVGLQSAKLERIQPMPVDFPSIGPQPVKNFVWRIQ